MKPVRSIAAAGLVAAMLAASPATRAAAPAAKPVYSQPMATIDGRGAIQFHVTFGMLVDAAGAPAGLYRSYPSSSQVPLSEQWRLPALGSKDGVILASHGNTAVLVLRGRIGTGVGIYPLTLTYLTDFASRKYATCTLRVAHEPGGRWQTVDGAGRPIEAYTIESRGLGIGRIENCSAATRTP